VSFFISCYNFNNAGIVTNNIFKKYVQDKRIFALFLRPKDIKKVLMEGNGRENKKKVCQPLPLSPTTSHSCTSRCHPTVVIDKRFLSLSVE
jgi:hypothetical protein